MDRATIVHETFQHLVAAGDLPQGAAPSGPLGPQDAVSLFRAQCLSRALELQSRAMQKAGQGFYTIGSSGHEGLAAVAAALRPTDRAFLHYRDAAFQIARANQVPGQSIAWDMLLSFAASCEDPISVNRHPNMDADRGSRLMGWMPPPDGIAMCQDGDVGIAKEGGGIHE